MEDDEIGFLAGTKEMERPGEVGRLSTEKRTEAEGEDEIPAKWTRVGDVERWWKKLEEVKDDVEEAKEEPPPPDKRPEGERERLVKEE